jgi:hypothetical protein
MTSAQNSIRLESFCAKDMFIQQTEPKNHLPLARHAQKRARASVEHASNTLDLPNDAAVTKLPPENMQNTRQYTQPWIETNDPAKIDN